MTYNPGCFCEDPKMPARDRFSSTVFEYLNEWCLASLCNPPPITLAPCACGDPPPAPLAPLALAAVMIEI